MSIFEKKSGKIPIIICFFAEFILNFIMGLQMIFFLVVIIKFTFNIKLHWCMCSVWLTIFDTTATNMIIVITN